MLLTDRNFNTSFYDPALRHSSFVFIIILILTSHNSLNLFNETVRGLSGGALANEPGFLGPVNSRTQLSFDCRKRSFSKAKGLRLAQAKNRFKIGSTYEIYFLNEIKKDLSQIFLVKRVRAFIAGNTLCGYSDKHPTQIRSYPLLEMKKLLISRINETHNGNLGKHLKSSTLLDYSYEFYKFMSSTFQLTKLLKSGVGRWNGGKILEQAKVECNTSNIRYSATLDQEDGNGLSGIHKMVQSKACPSLRRGKPWTYAPQRHTALNSIRLERANRWQINPTLQRGYVTDALNLKEYDMRVQPTPINWNEIQWRKVEGNVLKKQKDLVKLAGTLGIKHPTIQAKQALLAKTLDFRLLAVYQTSKNSGSKTPGIDNYLLSTPEQKIAMVENLKTLLTKAEKGLFKSTPVRRVMIPKANGKLRPLGIPTIQDRMLQAVINLVLEPLVEMTSDPNSYGFRKYRGTKNAVAAIRTNLQSGQESKWVLDADIKSFFDKINHNWLLSNIPLSDSQKVILKGWLKAGAVLNNTIIKTDEGTPQGGIISPTLANFTLNGLEATVRKSISSITGGKAFRKNVYKNGVRTKMLTFNVKTVRYADDFVVIAPSKRIIEMFIKPAVEAFLSERGLSLSSEKTKIFSLLSGTELHFLGYVFKYRENWSKKYSLFKDRIGKSGIALFPNKDKVKVIIKKLRLIFRLSQNLTAYELISKLNPIIRGWSNYYNMGESYHFRGYVRHALYHLVWKWAHKKHPKWGRRAIAATYFLGLHEEYQKLLKEALQDSSLLYNKWTFSAKTLANSRHSTKIGKMRALLDPTQVTKTVSARNYSIPNKYLEIHAYHEDIYLLINLMVQQNFKALGDNEGVKGKLLLRQKGLCPLCERSLYFNMEGSVMQAGNLHIDHIVPLKDGGSKTTLSNLRLLHRWCHNDSHNSPERN